MKAMAVIDGSELTQHGLAKMVDSVPGWTVAGCYATLRDFEASLNGDKLNAILLNDAVPDEHEFWTVIETWRERLPGVQIVVLSHHLTARHIERLLQRGVIGFLYRPDCTGHTLAACLTAIGKNQCYVSPSASVEVYRRHADADALGLFHTDLDVLHCLNEGLNTREIAARLGVSERSIHRARSRLRLALDVRINEQIIPAALRQGLLTERRE